MIECVLGEYSLRSRLTHRCSFLLTLALTLIGGGTRTNMQTKSESDTWRVGLTFFILFALTNGG